MTDTRTPEKRRQIMAAVRQRDTEPELALRRALHARGAVRGSGAGSTRVPPGGRTWLGRRSASRYSSTARSGTGILPRSPAGTGRVATGDGNIAATIRAGSARRRRAARARVGGGQGVGLRSASRAGCSGRARRRHAGRPRRRGGCRFRVAARAARRHRSTRTLNVARVFTSARPTLLEDRGVLSARAAPGADEARASMVPWTAGPRARLARPPAEVPTNAIGSRAPSEILNAHVEVRDHLSIGLAR